MVSRTILIFLVAGVCLAQKRDSEFNQLADRFFDEVVFRYDPVQGTQAGFHQYDAMLPSGSRADIEAQTAALHKFEQEVEGFDARGLTPTAAADRELVLAQIRGQLLSLEVIRPWEKNPDVYSSGVSSAVFVVMSRNFAPAAVRLKSVIAREKLMPRLFQSARENLKNPPRIYTEIALEQMPGIVSFFQNDVPAAFKDVSDGALMAEFQKTNQGVVDALNSYAAFLKTDLLPRSQGEFRIGAETYRKKLLYDEMVDIPLDRLLEIGRANLRRNQEEFTRVAAQVDKSRTAEQILNEAMLDHPAADKLMQSFRDVLSGLREFIEKNRIVTIPSKVPPIVEETPPFERAPTKVRKLMGCGSNAEGWAHYTEQMMLDEGYGKGDLKLRLGQLQDALLRNARFIVGIQMHTGKMTVDEAVEYFVTEGYQVRPVAEKEAKRGTSDPTYLVYTLGKLEILKLREDYKKMKGDKYTLQGFHDAFLGQGYPPVKMVRRALLGDDSPVL
jgi:uncharacterized protein (DUF885 family)